MINDGINDVPDKTIAVFKSPLVPDEALTYERITKIVRKPEKKREWFSPHFYRCLPLAIGNQYGFVISSEFDFKFEWNGGDRPEDLTIYFKDDSVNKLNQKYPNISSHFGHGIITINPAFFFRTPPGVNLMTISPPNYVLPNITHMTGVIETDNLRRNFTFNLKVQIPNLNVEIPAGYPLAAFIPIPRYYCDEFNLEDAENIFSKEIVEEEINADQDASRYRKTVEPTLKNGVGKHYMQGKDIYSNIFKDHQKP